MRLSARNQIPARVTGITSGEAIANVELDANGVRLVAPSPWNRSATSA
jgi:molybdopterin-binding protein